MILFATIALGFAVQDQDEAPRSGDTREYEAAAASLGQRLAIEEQEYLRREFDFLDRDRSDFIEPAEAPTRVFVPNAPPLDGDEAREHFVVSFDEDGNGKVSFDEFAHKARPQFLERGIPLTPADARVDSGRSSPYRETETGDEPRDFGLDDFEFVEASPQRVRTYVRQMFDGEDVDGSGFIELAEAPTLLAGARRAVSDPVKSYDPDDIDEVIEGDEARAQYIAMLDKDGDGKVSFDEYAEPTMPQYLARGIPLIPADWQPADGFQAR